MNLNADDDRLIRQYLLGDPGDREDLQRQIELRMLSEPEFADYVSLIEAEIIDEYAADSLSPRESQDVERYLFNSPDLTRSLEQARMLRETTLSSTVSSRGESSILNTPISRFSLKQKIAVVGILALGVVGIAGLGIGVLRVLFHPPKVEVRTEVESGLEALARAFDQERPIEGRISGFKYGRFIERLSGERPTGDPRHLEEAELLLLRAGRETPGARSQHALGKFYLAKKEYDEAIRAFEDAVKLEPRSATLHNDLGVAWFEKARESKYKRDDEASGVEFGKSLEEFASALRLDETLLEALFNTALSSQELNLYQQSAEAWKKYLSLDAESSWAREARSRLEEVEKKQKAKSEVSQSILSNFYAAYRDQDDARIRREFLRGKMRANNLAISDLLDRYLDAVKARKKADAEGLMGLFERVAQLETTQVRDRFTSDLFRYYRGLGQSRLEARLEARLDRVVQARSTFKEALAAYNDNRLVDAKALYEQSQRLFLEVGNLCEAHCAESWAIYCALRTPDAYLLLPAIGKLIRVYEAKSYRGLLAEAINAKADAHSSKDENEAAKNESDRSYRLAKEIGDVQSQIRNLNGSASMKGILGKHEEAIGLALTALETSEDALVDDKLTWNIYNLLSVNFLALGAPTAALMAQKEALGATSWRISRLLSLGRVGVILSRLGRKAEAEHYAGLLERELKQPAGSGDRPDPYDADRYAYLGHIYLTLGDYEQSRRCFRESIDRYGPKPQFKFLLFKAHEGMFTASRALGKTQEAAAEQQQLIALLDQYRAEIFEESNRNAFFESGAPVFDAIIDFEIDKGLGDCEALKLAEHSRARSLVDAQTAGARIIKTESGVDLKLPSPSDPLSIEAVQKKIPKGTQVLYYASLKNRLIIWLITPDRVIPAISAIGADELERSVGKLREQIFNGASPTNQALRSESNFLYEKLIRPVERDLAKEKTICIVPDKALHLLPFAALASPDSGRFLIEDFFFLVSPSATTFITCSEEGRVRGSASNEKLLIVGRPFADYEKYQLSAPKELGESSRAIASLYPNPIRLFENDAVESKVKAHLAEADIIHFACHGVPDQKRPLLSKLLLTPESGGRTEDGALHAYELYQASMPQAKLVILAACETGVGRAFRGEGMMNLARPFLSAKVPAIIGSLWKIESSSAAKLMTAFHSYRIKHRCSTVEALTMVQREAIKTESANGQPVAWASFVVMGGA